MEETFSFQNDLSDSENERDLMMNQAPIEQISTIVVVQEDPSIADSPGKNKRKQKNEPQVEKKRLRSSARIEKIEKDKENEKIQENEKNKENEENGKKEKIQPTESKLHPFFSQKTEKPKKKKEKEEKQKVEPNVSDNPSSESLDIADLFLSKEQIAEKKMKECSEKLKESLQETKKWDMEMSSGKQQHPFLQPRIFNQKNEEKTEKAEKVEKQKISFGTLEVPLPLSAIENHVGFKMDKEDQLFLPLRHLKSQVYNLENLKLVSNPNVNNSEVENVQYLKGNDAFTFVNEAYPGLQKSQIEIIQKLNNECQQLLNSPFNQEIVNKLNSQELWTEKYKPKSRSEVLGNQESVRQLYEWLVKWKKEPKNFNLNIDMSSQESQNDSDFEERVPKMRKEKKRDRYLNGEYNENGDYSNAMLLVGGYGTNKTCSVYAIAEELGMQVLEINSSTRRTGKEIMEMFGESTQSHLVLQDWQLQPIEEIPQPQKKKKTKKKTKNDTETLTELSFNTSAPASPTKQNLNKISIILVEEIDIIFEQDKGFWNAINSLIKISKRPIILTCNENTLQHLPNLLSFSIPVLQFYPIPFDATLYYIQLICFKEGFILNPIHLCLFILHYQDIRKILLNLQFWFQGKVKENWNHLLKSQTQENEKEENKTFPFLFLPLPLKFFSIISIPNQLFKTLSAPNFQNFEKEYLNMILYNEKSPEIFYEHFQLVVSQLIKNDQNEQLQLQLQQEQEQEQQQQLQCQVNNESQNLSISLPTSLPTSIPLSNQSSQLSEDQSQDSNDGSQQPEEEEDIQIDDQIDVANIEVNDQVNPQNPSEEILNNDQQQQLDQENEDSMNHLTRIEARKKLSGDLDYHKKQLVQLESLLEAVETISFIDSQLFPKENQFFHQNEPCTHDEDSIIGAFQPFRIKSLILDSSLEKKVEFSNAIGLLNAHQLQKRFVFDEPTMNSDNLYPPHSSTYTQHAINVNTLRLQKILQTFSIRNSFQQFIRDNFPIIKVICYSEMLRQNNQRKKRFCHYLSLSNFDVQRILQAIQPNYTIALPPWMEPAVKKLESLFIQSFSK